jgi:glycosyltransferase involved in cell wall biosynthesis
LRILRTIETFLPYVCGPVNQAFQISNRLESLGIESPVLTTYCDIAPELPSQDLIEKVKVTRFKNQFRLMRYCVSLGMAESLKNFDILHAHNYRNFQSDLGVFFSGLRRKPFILNTHGSLLGYKKYLPKGIPQVPYEIYDRLTFKSASRRADAIVVSSEFERNDAIEFGIDLNKIHVIPMGIDLPRVPEENKKTKDNPLHLLFVGRLARVRRVELLIQALGLMDFPVLATIVGGEEETASVAKGGYLNELKKLVEELKIEEKVEFVGRKTKNELWQYYFNSDIFIYPSLYENFGQPILEAAAAGLPIVSTNVGVARELVIESETGFIVSDEPKAIAARVRDLINGEMRKQMGEKMKQKVAADFGWEMVMKKYVKLYNSF